MKLVCLNRKCQKKLVCFSCFIRSQYYQHISSKTEPNLKNYGSFVNSFEFVNNLDLMFQSIATLHIDVFKSRGFETGQVCKGESFFTMCFFSCHCHVHIFGVLSIGCRSKDSLQIFLDTAELGYSYNAYSRNRTVVNISFIPFLHVVISLLFSPVCSQHGCSQLSMQSTNFLTH